MDRSLEQPVSPRAATLAGAALLTAPLLGLLLLKWPASLALVQRVQSSGVFTPRADAISAGGLPFWLRPLARTLSYLFTVRWALFYGLCISAAVRAFASPLWLARLFGGRGAWGHVAGGVAGAPLMLCSCCVAPVAMTVYRRSGKLGPALGLLLAAPSLNPAALVLTFLLFPRAVAFGRLAMAGAMVFVGAAFVAAASGKLRMDGGALEGERPPAGPRAAVLAFVLEFWRTSVATLPLIVLGVLVSAVLIDRVELASLAAPGTRLFAIAVAAALAVPIALPTFFEIPLGLLLVQAGAPAGAVAALLFAGSAVNLPSLLTVARAVRPRSALALAAAVFAVALAGGAALELAARL